ncbi:hypothetical protein K501DRAFT_247799 [Backusella circina FSU 941]|nr:hypothetical protein K501DRAFT_247799 [Backusella circina FSU 941]
MELEFQEYFNQDHFPTLFNDLNKHSFQPLSPQSESSSSYGSTSPSDDNAILDVSMHEIFSNYVQIPSEIANNNIKSESLKIKVLGVQSTGAKSRVETQIKLCVQLVASDGRKVSDWSYIKVKEDLLTRSKLKKSNQKQADGSVTTLVSDESEILQLDAKVVCASKPEYSIRSCIGCVRRERKRSERTKEGKSKSKPYQQQDLEEERDRILLFNCNPLINFSSGDAILPTRITCYCRHHNEKQGFKVCFALRNNRGETVATGVSPPIMITDDHKSSKQQNSRKRAREQDLVTNHIETPASSRRGSLLANDEVISLLDDYIDIPTIDSAILNPRLEHIVPSQGPTYGGIEVSILGSGFYEGLTCMFGEHAATTVYWNETTMVCILPPASHTGPVVVSFKEYPLILEGQDVAFFTYFDASDQALMQLALQVVGMKMTGKLQDAKQVAMQIVQGNQKTNTTFEEHVISTLKNSSISDQNMIITNFNGHSLLHFAALLNYTKLAKTLLGMCSEKRRLVLLHSQDRCGMTALHFASQLNSSEMVRLLLESGANPLAISLFGTSSEVIPKFMHKKAIRDNLLSLIESHTRLFSSNSYKSQLESDELGIYLQEKNDSYSHLGLSTLIGKGPSLCCQELITHATSLFYKYTVAFGFFCIQASTTKLVKPAIEALTQKNALYI